VDDPQNPANDAGFVIHRISTPDGVVADAAALGDVTRWRTRIASDAMGLRTGFSADGLALHGYPTPLPIAGRRTHRLHVYSADSPVPLPAVQAGPSSSDLDLTAQRLAVLDGEPVPLRVVGTAAVLPAVGESGVLVDLDGLNHVAIEPVRGIQQVWLAPVRRRICRPGWPRRG